jgi:hypothetical protein
LAAAADVEGHEVALDADGDVVVLQLIAQRAITKPI